MARLNNHTKEFIVKQLAMFEPPSRVRGLVKEKFDIEISRQQVGYYNPENRQGGRELARKWRHLFDATRDEFIAGAFKIPITHKHYRLHQLQKLYEEHVRRENLTQAQDVLEQAAKEAGGAYGNGSGATGMTDDEGMNFYEQVNQKILELNKN